MAHASRLRHDRVRGVEIAINVYKPRTASAPEPVAHDGCEFGVVLDGILEVTVGGRIHELQKGDLISYPSTEPHRFANTSSSPARTIWLNLKRDPDAIGKDQTVSMPIRNCV